MLSKSLEPADSSVWRSFTLNITFVVLLFILGLFIGLFLNNKQLIETEYLTRAKSHFNNIVLTRRWSAQYGGVYVEKKAGMQSNPYLINPDILGVNGTTYTLKNPALMTREISVLADKDGLYKFHITSLKPLNPDNFPDEFEKAALASFESGVKESTVIFEEGDKTVFRYMAPLKTEQPCLKCHAAQGYKGGEVRGGISISFDITQSAKNLAQQKYILAGLFVITSALLLGIIYQLIFKLNKRILDMQHELQRMVHIDQLTGINNRGRFMELLNMEIDRARRYDRTFSLLMLDLDHFKSVNDTHGHAAGDEALRTMARVLQTSGLRQCDFLGRIGGEEFAVTLPETTLNHAAIVAERIGTNLAATPIVFENKEFFITASIGVAENIIGDTQESIMGRADQAMYNAKNAGRNRVSLAS